MSGDGAGAAEGVAGGKGLLDQLPEGAGRVARSHVEGVTQSTGTDDLVIAGIGYAVVVRGAAATLRSVGETRRRSWKLFCWDFDPLEQE